MNPGDKHLSEVDLQPTHKHYLRKEEDTLRNILPQIHTSQTRIHTRKHGIAARHEHTSILSDIYIINVLTLKFIKKGTHVTHTHT